MPSTRVLNVSGDDCDIIYERITSSNRCRTQENTTEFQTGMNCSCKLFQNHHWTCRLGGSEYAHYVADELDLFIRLQSGPIECSADKPAKTLSEKSIDPETGILGTDNSPNSTGTDCEKNSDPMDCEVLWAKSENSSHPSTDQPVPKELSDFKDLKSPPKEMSLTPENCDFSNDQKQEPKTSAESTTLDLNCRVCPSSFASVDDLKSHLLDHVNDTKSTARIYNDSIVSLQQLDYKVAEKILKKGHMCTICKKSFVKRTKMYRHVMASHSEGRPWRCFLCPKNYTRRDHLRRHERTH